MALYGFTLSPRLQKHVYPFNVLEDMWADAKHVLGFNSPDCTVSNDDHTTSGHLNDLGTDALRLLPVAFVIALVVAAIFVLPVFGANGNRPNTEPVSNAPVIVPPLAVASPTATAVPTSTAIPSPTPTVVPTATPELLCSATYCFEREMAGVRPENGCEPMPGLTLSTWPPDLDSPGEGWTWYLFVMNECPGVAFIPPNGSMGYIVYKVNGDYVEYYATFPETWAGKGPNPAP